MVDAAAFLTARGAGLDRVDMELPVVPLVAAIVVGGALALWLSRMLRRRRARRRQLRAQRAERDAEDVLVASGYRVLERQPRARWTLTADGRPVTVDIRPDYLVTRAGRRYVAEVKSGAAAPSLSSGATRRQLLEYALAHGTDTALLVDMQRGRVREIAFQVPTRPARVLGWMFAAAIATAVAVATLLQR
jgi:hypothetical protein